MGGNIGGNQYVEKLEETFSPAGHRNTVSSVDDAFPGYKGYNVQSIGDENVEAEILRVVDELISLGTVASLMIYGWRYRRKDYAK